MKIDNYYTWWVVISSLSTVPNQMTLIRIVTKQQLTNCTTFSELWSSLCQTQQTIWRLKIEENLVRWTTVVNGININCLITKASMHVARNISTSLLATIRRIPDNTSLLVSSSSSCSIKESLTWFSVRLELTVNFRERDGMNGWP